MTTRDSNENPTVDRSETMEKALGSAAASPGEGQDTDSSRPPLFVIHKHRNNGLYYDLRLEITGVLKSWALPEGPTTDPTHKHRATPSEDFALDAAYFEGVIPAGQYGAGTLLVWDTGTYRNLRDEHERDISIPMGQALEDGEIRIWLEGQKLRGGYSLVRVSKGKSSESWQLTKLDDEEANVQRNITEEEPNSVLTDRSLDQVRQSEQEEQS